MKPAARFLHAFAQALSAMNLYAEGHPAREEAASDAFRALEGLLEEESAPSFSFLGQEVVFNDRQLREMQEWQWSRPLAQSGIERIEFREGVLAGEFDEFLSRVRERLENGGPEGEEGKRGLKVIGAEGEEVEDWKAGDLYHIRFGRIARGEDQAADAALQASYPIDEEERQALDFMFDEVQGKAQLSGAIAEAVVRSLSVALHEETNVLNLLAPLKESDQYTTVHSMNVAMLSMGMAEKLGYGHDQVRVIGEAGLLHDSGKVRIPDEILNKTGKLTDEEFEVIKQHPEDGARIILEHNRAMEIAAVVAYEHHMQYGGGGYPRTHYRREMHPVSRIVHVCDVYDSLRTTRPYRDSWESEKIVRMMEERTGTEFHPEYVNVFTELIRTWDIERSGEARQQREELEPAR